MVGRRLYYYFYYKSQFVEKVSNIFQIHELMSVSNGVGFREIDGPVEDQHLSVVDRLVDLDVLEQRLDIQNDLLDAVLYDPII
jgi:hypothetical protein